MCTSRKSAVKPREIVSNVISKMTRKEVVRDKIWDKCLANAVDFYSLKEPDDRCHKLADATWKTKMSYKRLQLKKDSLMSILIDQTPDPVVQKRTSAVLCGATTVSGKPCSFRAVCGQFCRKHKVSANVEIGTKINV